LKPLLALTMGDINGVGPEIVAKVLAMEELRRRARLLVIGDRASYEESRRFAPDAPGLYRVNRPEAADWGRLDRVPLMDGGLEIPGRRPGRLEAEAGRCAAEWVKLATRLALEGSVDAVVTAPLNKEAMHLAGFKYPGHTELIAELCGTADFRLGLFCGDMRVVHNSTHCSLRQAIELTKPERIVTTLRIADSALQRLGLPKRRIAVCGLNPHAGEAGAFGMEEIEEIAPAIERARREGLDCAGPFPADTVYNRMQAGHFEMVVAMYHDQGHAPMKLVAMDDTVNVTLGIPIIRTSADHGTAFDIAGTGRARPNSLKAATELAALLAQKDPP
jgi:4-phospho-D-threonate 3-dehydrogenase / 4-phospho-D-erythronate 3-dehydrogenase